MQHFLLMCESETGTFCKVRAEECISLWSIPSLRGPGTPSLPSRNFMERFTRHGQDGLAQGWRCNGDVKTLHKMAVRKCMGAIKSVRMPLGGRYRANVLSIISSSYSEPRPSPPGTSRCWSLVHVYGPGPVPVAELLVLPPAGDPGINNKAALPSWSKQHELGCFTHNEADDADDEMTLWSKATVVFSSENLVSLVSVLFNKPNFL